MFDISTNEDFKKFLKMKIADHDRLVKRRDDDCKDENGNHCYLKEADFYSWHGVSLIHTSAAASEATRLMNYSLDDAISLVYRRLFKSYDFDTNSKSTNASSNLTAEAIQNFYKQLFSEVDKSVVAKALS